MSQLRLLGPGRSDDWAFAIPELGSTLGCQNQKRGILLQQHLLGGLFLILITIVIIITTTVMIMAN